jgi:sugar lactone lactonase YvrE
MNQSSVQSVLPARARLGEGPVWDAEHQQLYWVDIYNHRVHQFVPATGDDRYFDVGDLVSAIVLAGSNRLLLALSNRLVYLHLATGTITPLCQLAFPDSTSRCNDGKCDPQGRFWIGSISETTGQAVLYRYDPDGTLHLMETGLTISNGLGWSPDGTTFYLTDSPERKIYAYDFDPATGGIENRRILIDLGDEAVEPDGLTVDAQGNIWSALWDGWCVVCFSPTGIELQRVKLPVQRPTSVTFGGADLSDLYITSASVGLSQQEIQQGFYAGDLFRLSIDATGLPTQSFFSPIEAEKP